MVRTSGAGKFAPLIAVAALGAAGVVVPPAAHADRTCTIVGDYLELHQSNDAGYDIVVGRDGYSGIGPRGLARATPSQATYGAVNGYIAPSTGYIDFTISWDDPKTWARFTGTVGGDGIARGTSEGAEVPTNLWKQGPWVSTSKFDCVQDPAQAPPPPPPENKPAQPPLVSTDTGLTGVTFHVTDRSGVASQCTYSSEGFDKQFALPANATVDVFVPAIRQFRNRTGTIQCDNKTTTATTVFY
jgi:hypothetical protein